jgi:serine/threonine protein phosphatase PrpC
VTLPRSGYTIRYAYVSQRGYYPDSPDKPNQDSFCVHTSFNGDAEQHLFGVFDGHGDCGTQSSQFARDKVGLGLGFAAALCCLLWLWRRCWLLRVRFVELDWFRRLQAAVYVLF